MGLLIEHVFPNEDPTGTYPPSHSTFDILNIVLAIFYGLLGVVALFQLAQIIYYKHKFQSFHSVFLIHVVVFSALRTTFFLCEETLEEEGFAFYALFRFAINIEFSLFSLLIVYYAHLHHIEKVEWYDLKRKYIAAWIISNLGLWVLQIVWVIFESKKDTPLPSPSNEGSVGFHSIPNFLTGVVFGLLMLVLVWHGWKLVRKMREEGTKQHQTRLVARVSWMKISAITVILFICFSLRCIYDFVSGVTKSQTIVISISDDSDLYQIIFKFLAYTVWEVLPTALVFVLFGRIPPTSLGVFSSPRLSRVPHRSQLRRESLSGGVLAADPEQSARIFSDPKRYDSDEETTPLYRSGMGGTPGSFQGNNAGSLTTFKTNFSINSENHQQQPASFGPGTPIDRH